MPTKEKEQPSFQVSDIQPFCSNVSPTSPNSTWIYSYRIKNKKGKQRRSETTITNRPTKTVINPSLYTNLSD